MSCIVRCEDQNMHLGLDIRYVLDATHENDMQLQIWKMKDTNTDLENTMHSMSESS